MVDLSKLTAGKNLTEVEDSVLRYIIEHMDSMLKMGVRGVAKENYTSTSTIMRLTKKSWATAGLWTCITSCCRL